jgi:hypothetical protein
MTGLSGFFTRGDGHREHPLTAQLIDPLLEVEGPGVPLAGGQVVVAHEAGERRRRVAVAQGVDRAQGAPGGLGRELRIARVLEGQVGQHPHQHLRQLVERLVLRVGELPRPALVAVDRVLLRQLVRERVVVVVVRVRTVDDAAVAELDADRVDVVLGGVEAHEGQVEGLVDRAVVVDEEVARQAALVVEHVPAHRRAVDAVVVEDELADHRLGRGHRGLPHAAQRRTGRVASQALVLGLGAVRMEPGPAHAVLLELPLEGGVPVRRLQEVDELRAEEVGHRFAGDDQFTHG